MKCPRIVRHTSNDSGVFFMSKYSYQLKIHAVQEYLSKECSYAEVCRKFDIHSKRKLITWVHEAQANGYESLAPRKTHHSYSLDFKLQVVNYYRMHELSTVQVAVKFNLNRSQVYSWYRKYKNEGIVGLRPKQIGRPTKAMNKRKMIKKSKIQPTKEEQYKQKIAELEAKVANQEMEIDILKKLRALRQQRGENKH